MNFERVKSFLEISAKHSVFQLGPFIKSGEISDVWSQEVIPTINGQWPEMPPGSPADQSLVPNVNRAEVEQPWNSTSRRADHAASWLRVWGGGREGLAR